MRRGAAAVVLALALAAPAGAQQSGDAAFGARLFGIQCKPCHSVGRGAVNRTGPVLNGLFGRRAASVEGFDYSRSMRRMGADGLTWTFETLEAYLANPRALVSGTRMSYRGMADPDARAALMAYLRTWSDKPRDIPEAEPTASPSTPHLPPEVLAIEGDREYGAYLAAECAACHQRDGSDQGVPSITRWNPADFVAAMHAYKQKLRPHPVMQMMAGRLSNEEIAALAAYFATVQ